MFVLTLKTVFQDLNQSHYYILIMSRVLVILPCYLALKFHCFAVLLGGKITFLSHPADEKISSSTLIRTAFLDLWNISVKSTLFLWLIYNWHVLSCVKKSGLTSISSGENDKNNMIMKLKKYRHADLEYMLWVYLQRIHLLNT